MIDNEHTPSSLAGGAQAAPEASAGAMLRHLRESAGVHAAVLASVLKVPQQKLEALESDQLDQLPDVTFARGLAAAICRAFGADPAPVLARMPTAAHALRTRDAEINQSFRGAGDRPASMLSTGLSKPLMVVVGLLLLGAAVLWLLPTLPIQLNETSQGVSADGSVSEVVMPGPPAEAVEPSAPSTGVAPDEQASAAASSTPVSEPTSESASEGAAGTPAQPASVPASAAVAADQLLVIEASAETWVTVRDAAGKLIINRALTDGETVGLAGELPLAVTIGRKDAVKVTIRGEPMDLGSVGRSNVARFQVQ